jgi:hypothetical protein
MEMKRKKKVIKRIIPIRREQKELIREERMEGGKNQ